MSKIKIKSSEFNSILKEAISNVMARENTPAIQRISLKEIKLIAEKIINESVNNEYDLPIEAPSLGAEFDIHIFPTKDDIRYWNYELVDGSYDPQFKNDIINWINNNENEIVTQITEYEDEFNHQTVDANNEYSPEDYINY